jgi:shikimate dehydrogenase
MKIYGLIGFPLTHSFSKKFFTEKFTQEAIIDCLFELFPLEQIDSLPALLKAQPSLAGLAVTIPYKESAMAYLDEVDEVAKAIGSVNCIAIHSAGTKGFNTDYIGFRSSILPLLGPSHQKALVLGTGGSSKAIQFVLRELSIPYLLVSRNSSNHPGSIAYESLDESIMQTHTIVINCTPLGMYPDIHTSPVIPYECIGSQHLLFDLVYNPSVTTFLQKGMQQGATVKNGYEMLVHQAEANWKIWNQQ